MQVTIWHNPRCSKSRETLKLLESKGHTPEIRHYLDDVPTVEELRAVLQQLGISAVDLVRRQEQAFKARGLSKDSPEDQLLAAMTEEPKLIERPVVITAKGAALGRPPENVLHVL